MEGSRSQRSSSSESVVDRLARLRNAYSYGSAMVQEFGLSERVLQAQQWTSSMPEGQGIKVELTAEEFLASQAKGALFIPTNSSAQGQRKPSCAGGRSNVDLSRCARPAVSTVELVEERSSSSRMPSMNEHSTQTQRQASLPSPSSLSILGWTEPALSSSARESASGALQQISEVVVGVSDEGSGSDCEPDAQAEEVPALVMPLHRSSLRVEQLANALSPALKSRDDSPTTSLSKRPSIAGRILSMPGSPKLPSSPSHASSQFLRRPQPPSLQMAAAALANDFTQPCSSPKPPEQAAQPSGKGAPGRPIRMPYTKSCPIPPPVSVSSNAHILDGVSSTRNVPSPFLATASSSWLASDLSSPTGLQHPTNVVRHLRRQSTVGQPTADGPAATAEDRSEPSPAPTAESSHADPGDQRHCSVDVPRWVATMGYSQDGQASSSPRASPEDGSVPLPAAERELQRLRSSLHTVASKSRGPSSVRSSWSETSHSQPLPGCKAVSLHRQVSQRFSMATLAALRAGRASASGASTPTRLAEEGQHQRASHSGEIAHGTCLLPPGDPPSLRQQPPVMHAGNTRYKFEYKDNKPGATGFKAKVLPGSHQVQESVLAKNRNGTYTIKAQSPAIVRL